MRRPALPSVAELCTNAARVAVLENVMNPTNIGAIFRSAAALGVDAVLLTSAGSDPLYRRAVRVSMGTVFQVPWTYLPADTDWQETLHTFGFRTAAMALRDDSLRIDDARLRALPRLAIVLGTEGDGLANDTIADCDYTVRIPMSHGETLRGFGQNELRLPERKPEFFVVLRRRSGRSFRRSRDRASARRPDGSSWRRPSRRSTRSGRSRRASPSPAARWSRA